MQGNLPIARQNSRQHLAQNGVIFHDEDGHRL
jgi:hypothetical protein